MIFAGVRPMADFVTVMTQAHRACLSSGVSLWAWVVPGVEIEQWSYGDVLPETLPESSTVLRLELRTTPNLSYRSVGVTAFRFCDVAPVNAWVVEGKRQ